MLTVVNRARRVLLSSVVIRATLATIAIGIAPVSPLLAQPQAPLRFTLATGALAPFLGAVSLDAEARVSDGGLSVGFGGTYDTNREYLSWWQTKLKYAIRGEALRGAAIGATAGMVVSRNNIRGECNPTACPFSNQAFPSVGVIADWNWFPGSRDRLMLGAGIGVQKLFGTSGFPVDPLQLDGRLVIGIGF